MQYKLTYRKFLVLLLVSIQVLFNSCVEELELQTENFESILVIEGIITDQNEKQEVKISRSYRLEEDGPAPVSNATVRVLSSNGEEYNFQLDSLGIYTSEIDFAVQPGVAYTLEVQTNEGSYNSTTVTGQQPTQIDNVSSTKTNYRNETGVGILVSSSDEGSGNYYKYEYEETYKIKAPYEKSQDLIVNEEGGFELVFKTREEYICYNTLPSREIVLSNTNNLSDNSISNYLVRFLSMEDYKIAHRYSILVKQLKISAEAHAFYTTLENLSESENIFSQYQPGFLNGNIISQGENGERVIGFFTTASVDQERLFFNYTDYFDVFEDPRPVIYAPCDPYQVIDRELRELIQSGEAKFFSYDPLIGYKIIAPPCIDCNFFGTNVQPDFWIE